jgi:pyruvate ferredoxin oxidoreductase alpha subunit
MKKFLSGNEAAAEAVELARVKNVFGYPITPSTSLTEELAKKAAAGKINAFTQMESEFGTLSACIGAALAGARTFTATSSQGLLYMAEVIFAAARKRLPIVLVNVNRALGPPWGLNDEWTDSMSLRDSGWLQYYAASPQEALDFIIIAYRLAEDRYIKLPTMVCCGGFYVSHAKEPVEIPSQESIDRFLPPNVPLVPLNSEFPVSLGGLLSPEEYAEYLKSIEISMDQVSEIEEKIFEEYFRLIGRKYQPVFVHNPQKSKTIIVTLGSIANTVRFAVDEQEIDAGLLKINRFRPFPSKEIKEILDPAEKIIVLDRDFGAGGATTSGIIAQSVREAFFSKNIISAVVGLNGRDVSDRLIAKILANTEGEKEDRIQNFWPDLKTDILDKPLEMADFREEKLTLLLGHGACPGCGLALPLKIAIEAIKGPIIIPASCASVITWSNMTSAVTVPKDTVNFASASGVATGLSQGLKSLGKSEKVFVFAGDGATYDIGLAGLSGAAERNENFIYICYTNQGYMNTGAQRSSGTPRFAMTTTSIFGEKGFEKDIVAIMAAHRIPYLATASLYKNKNFDGLEDYRQKLKKAENIQGFSFILVFSPCPTGWKSESENGVLLSELAVETGSFPLLEMRDGELKINYEPEEFIEIKEYLKLQKRFKIPANNQLLVEEIKKEIAFKWKKLKSKTL